MIKDGRRVTVLCDLPLVFWLVQKMTSLRLDFDGILNTPILLADFTYQKHFGS